MSRLKPIEGYEGYYVSDEGHIYSDKYNRRVELKPRRNKGGYLYVNLYRKGKMKSTTVHRIVAKAFLKGVDSLKEVNHIDGVKTNNRITNLEMVTRRENRQHAVKMNLHVSVEGEDHWCAKLTEGQVREIRNKYIPHRYTQKTLAGEYGVSVSAIKYVLLNKTWKSVIVPLATNK